MYKIRIVLVDDHKLITDSLAILLNHNPKFKVVGAVNDPRLASDLILTRKPDIVLVDISMAPIDGFEVAGAIIKLGLDTKIIFLSFIQQLSYVKRMFSAHGHGFVTKNSSIEELTEAIRTVCSGKKYICKEVRDKLVNSEFEIDDGLSPFDKLNQRELEIITLLAQGLFSREIGEKLGLNTRTIEAHRHHILKKLGVPNVAALINYASTMGVLK